MAEAHKISQGEGVTVAVIDTGVDPHPDLEGNLIAGSDVFPGGKGNGQEDPDGHGTRMGGIIGAHGHGNEGALGIAPKANILPIRYKDADTPGDTDIFAKGINQAIASGAKVISMSTGGGPSRLLNEAVRKALAADVVLVAAGGNKPFDYGITFPAYIDGVVAVGATDQRGSHAEISTTGRQLAISAPGVDIWSTSRNGKYSKGTGTSDATAIEAGAAALVRSRYPQLSAKEVVHRLTATAVDKGAPGRDEVYGYGVLDLVAALTADVPPLGDGPAASPSAKVSPTVAGPAGPDDAESGDRGSTLLITVGTLVVLGVVGGWLFLRARRRRPDAAG